MKKKLFRLKRKFKPYYEIVLSKYNLTDNSKPIKGFDIVKCYKFETLVKYQSGKRYINSDYITFEKFVKKALQL